MLSSTRPPLLAVCAVFDDVCPSRRQLPCLLGAVYSRALTALARRGVGAPARVGEACMGCGVCLAPAAFACSCILWQRYVRLWSRNLRSLSGACFLRASVQGTSVARHQIDSWLYETDDKTGQARERTCARVCWKLVQACKACCAPGFPAGTGEVVVLRAHSLRHNSLMSWLVSDLPGAVCSSALPALAGSGVGAPARVGEAHMGCGVCLAPAAFACSCKLWQPLLSASECKRDVRHTATH